MGVLKKAKEAIKNAGSTASKKVQTVKTNVATKVGSVAVKAGQTKDAVKNKVNNVVDKVKDAGRFKLLLPLAPSMFLMLKATGSSVKANDGIEAIAEAFYNKVVMGRQTFQTNHVIPPEAIDAVVSAIFSFVKNLKAKKAAGKDLTDAEKQLVETGDKVAEVVAETVAVDKEKEKEKVDGNIFTDYWLVWLSLLVILAIVAKKKGWI